MALTAIEEVRTGIGDFIVPYILTDEQIQHYLDSNSGDIDATVDELQPIVLSALASRGAVIRAEDLMEDNTDQAKNYEAALKRGDQSKAIKANPIIGGAANEVSLSIDMFDPDNVEV